MLNVAAVESMVTAVVVVLFVLVKICMFARTKSAIAFARTHTNLCTYIQVFRFYICVHTHTHTELPSRESPLQSIPFVHTSPSSCPRRCHSQRWTKCWGDHCHSPVVPRSQSTNQTECSHDWGGLTNWEGQW